MLHLIHQSPFLHTNFNTCLRVASPGSTILLYADGVYAAVVDGCFHSAMQMALTQHPIFALLPDIKARGIEAKIMGGIQLIDYLEFVELTEQQTTICTW